MKFFEKIFSIKNDNNFHKVWTIIGVKFKFNNKNKLMKSKLDNILNNVVDLNNSININNNNIDLIKTEQKEIKSVINKLEKEQDFVKSNVEKIKIEQNITQNDIKKFYSNYKNEVNKSLYRSEVEIKHLQPFLKYYEREDFVDKYKSLIKNLDEDSILNINRIIANHKKCKDAENLFVDVYSNEEKVQVEYLKSNFLNLIIKLNENAYAYKNYLLPINWFEACVFYYKHGINAIKNLERIKNKNIIDAGAFIGDSALILSEFTDKNIYSFEMLPKHIDLINKTIELNNLTNVIPINKALGNENKTVKININTSSTSIKEFQHAEILETSEAEMITLDDFVKEHNIEVGLIKTDLEGAEQEFLKGAENTIKTQKPTLLISIYHNPSDMFEIKPMIESWDLGYKFKILKQPEMLHLETMLIAEVEE